MVQFKNCFPRVFREPVNMAQLSCCGSIVLLLATACLAFGAPAQANPSSKAKSSPVPSESSTMATGSDDGFQRTVKAFQLFEKKGKDITAALRKLLDEVVAGNPGDTAKQQAQFLKKLTELYPGSTYDGATGTGTVAFQKDFVATFTNTLNVDSLKELGAVKVTYLLEHSKIQLSDGLSSVTVLIDKSDPSRSRFSIAVIPAIRDESETILTIPGYKRIATDSVETSILNDAYQLLSQTNALRMDYFAADIMRYPALQSKALGIAGKGYFERHRPEYQVGAEPAKPAKKSVDGASQKRPIDFAGFISRLLLIGVLVAGVFWIVGILSRRVKFMFMDKMAQTHVKKYYSLSPLVTRSLKRLGTSLWGKNFLWSKKYYIIKRSDRWLLCDGKNAKKGQKSLVKNRLEVCMRDSNFKLKITRLNGVGVDVAATCKDYSERELTEKLTELRALVVAAKTAPESTES
jgi:hypothetical protein